MRNEIGSVLETNAPLTIDLPALVVSRLLIQASSGGGKSYLVRRLLEQTHGQVQQIVIDVEGEFASLRERFDYVLASKDGGETTVDPRAASLLALRLLELKASAILDLSELSHNERVRFVATFVAALVDSPKTLWHSALIVIDEAQMFCPQDGKAESTEAVMNLCTRGRKRGFAPVLATQRLSQLNKNAAAECLNRFIGRTSLDVDMKRAGDDLGFDKTRRLDLRKLKPGQFYAFGPAIASEVTLMRVGTVVTKHPKAGGRIRFKAPPPTAHIKALLPKLSDLPAEAETRERTAKETQRALQSAERKAADLERDVKRHLATIADLEKRPMVEKPLVRTAQIAKIDRATERIADGIAHLDKLASTMLAPSLETLRNAIKVKAPAPVVATHPLLGRSEPVRPVTHAPPRPEPQTTSDDQAPLSHGNAAFKILGVLKAYPNMPDARVGALARVSATKSTYRVAISKLRSRGYIVQGDTGWVPTAAGLEVVKHVAGPPSGADAVNQWRQKFRGVALSMFNAILEYGREGALLDMVSSAIGKPRDVSTFRVALGRLKQHGVITVRGEHVTINESLL